MIDGYGVGPLKINNISGNASINFGDATFTASSVTKKTQGVAFSIGDGSAVWGPMYNNWFDPDIIDQDESASPAASNPLQT